MRAEPCAKIRRAGRRFRTCQRQGHHRESRRRRCGQTLGTEIRGSRVPKCVIDSWTHMGKKLTIVWKALKWFNGAGMEESKYEGPREVGDLAKLYVLFSFSMVLREFSIGYRAASQTTPVSSRRLSSLRLPLSRFSTRIRLTKWLL